MAEEFKTTITSDKVETNELDYATLRADQRYEGPLIPRKNPFRQRKWSVTLEKGSVYDPQEDVGLYAAEVDCKYGVQINGTVFGRDEVRFEHGGAAYSALGGDDGTPTVGARVIGSVASEGVVSVMEPSTRADDWKPRPVEIYGDVVCSRLEIDAPTLIYGNVSTDTKLKVGAPALVFGDVVSTGSVDATELFAFSIRADRNVELGENVVVVNPTIWSREGNVRLSQPVGLLDSTTLAKLQEDGDLDDVALGLWLFESEVIWNGATLAPIDVSRRGEGAVASRAWRTANVPDDEFAFVRTLLERLVEGLRNDRPNVDEFRYASYETEGDYGGPTYRLEATDGDIIMGDQTKTVDQTESETVDRSETTVEDRTEVHDESTVVEDSVVSRSEIGGGTEADDSTDDPE